MAIIGLQMYTVRNHMKDKEELKDTLTKVARIGYQQVQITVPAYITPEETRAMLDDLGLKADSALAHSMKFDEEYESVLHTAKVLGTNVVRLDGIPKDMAQSPEGYKQYAAILNKGGKRFRDAGMDMYYHFHAFEWTNFPQGVRGIDILLSETNPEYVGFQPDVFWLTSAGTEPSQSLKMFKGRAKYIHVKDYAIKPRTGAMEDVPNCFASVGKGNLNWPGILATAREMGIQQFVVEQDQCDGDVFDCIKESYDNLKKMGV